MSFLHKVYVGDFEILEGPRIRMTRTSEDPMYKPVVRRPLDPGVVERIASRGKPTGAISVIPADWSIWAEDGYLVCDRYALGVDEILFLKRMVEETGCRLFELGFEVSVDDLTPTRHGARAGEVPTAPTPTP